MKSFMFFLFIVLAVDMAEARRDQVRQKRQKARIGEGVQSGELTRPEAMRMRAGQRAVDRMQERATADGVVTAKEKRRLEKAQDRLSKQIYKQKHDDQRRTDPPGQQPAPPAAPPAAPAPEPQAPPPTQE